MSKIKLGQTVKDRVTGFTGIAVCKCIYLNGCIQYDVKPHVNEKGENITGLWVDEQQLGYVDEGVNVKSEPTGGGFRSHPND